MVQQSVVTPERYAKGYSYEEYVSRIERNRERFRENYEGTTVPDAELAEFKALMARPNGPAKILVLGEDWCPDVFRGMPVFARIAEATGMELRIFPRDENKDIMGEFLHHGEFESIPVAVFYTKDMEYIAHFTERPELANQEMRSDEVRAMYQRMRKPDKTPEEADKAKQEYVAFQTGPMWSNWRQETIRECIRMLKDKVA